MPIQDGGQDFLCSIQIEEKGSNSLGRENGEQQDKKECCTMESVLRDLKKKNSPTPKPQGQLLQVSDPESTIVVETGQEAHISDHVPWGCSPIVEGSSSNRLRGETTTGFVGSSSIIMGISSAVHIHGQALELARVVKKRLVKVFIDSGSSGNYISASACTAWGLVPMVNEDNEEEVTPANGAKVQIEGHIQFQLRCGEYRRMIHARVFPLLHKEFILGLPWLQCENPNIDWTLDRVTAYRAGRAVLLQVMAQTIPEPELSSLNLLSAKQVQWLARKGKLQHAFLGFV